MFVMLDSFLGFGLSKGRTLNHRQRSRGKAGYAKFSSTDHGNFSYFG